MSSIPSSPVSDHAAKPDMAGGCVDRLGVARGRTVTAAGNWGAEMRATPGHPSGDFDIRLAGVITCGLGAAAWIFRDAAGFGRIGVVLLSVPVGGPFPDIADHVVNAVSVRHECGNRGGSFVTVVVQILTREF